MTRTLLLARHGQTAWNAEQRLQGHADVPLDEVGRAQAVALGAALVSLRPARLWSSDLSRAHETAAAVGAACGLEVGTDARLREYDLGARSGMTHAEIAAEAPEEFAAWRTGDGSVPWEEDVALVAARTSAALREHLAEIPQGGLGVVVMHGACLKTALGVLLDWPGARTGLTGMGNGRVAVLVEDGSALHLTAYNLAPGAVAALPGPDFASRAAAR